MAYDTELADRVRAYLSEYIDLEIEEKKMFGGLAFMVNGKMCVNVSRNRLMCRFNPKRQEELSKKNGFEFMNMKGQQYNGYCYVHSEGYDLDKDFDFWIGVCLEFNKKAKQSKKSVVK